ncbi:hypothetical protein [Nisaea sediminum]|uniref:hypothetical protein n=1 Tax=Nisaea sediminum TaxID=2775867 RepID=UPI001865C156|nr:hypothetical protein [Nisaea sediminum]
MPHGTLKTLRPVLAALFLAGLAGSPLSDARAACDLPVDDLCTNDAYYPDGAMEHAAAHCVGTGNRQQTCSTPEGQSQFNTDTCADGDDVAVVRESLQALCAAMSVRDSCNIVDGSSADSHRMYATLADDVGYTRPADDPNGACIVTRRASFLYSDRTQNGERTIRVFNAYPQR